MACIILMFRRDDNYCYVDNLIVMSGKPNCFIGNAISNALRPLNLQSCIERINRKVCEFLVSSVEYLQMEVHFDDSFIQLSFPNLVLLPEESSYRFRAMKLEIIFTG